MHAKSSGWRGYLEVGVASTLLHTVKRIRSGTEEEEPLGDKMAAPPRFTVIVSIRLKIRD